MKSYKDLEIYQLSLELFFKVHPLSLRLPNYELYELGSQVRRSAASVDSNIVEGYGRRSFKKDFLRFLTIAHASSLETQNHIFKIKTLYPEFKKEYEDIEKDYNLLGAKIYNFIEYVKLNWRT